MDTQTNKPVVSVIVPFYNVEKYIRRCMLSLINQESEYSYEILAVDDGSTDGSADIVKQLAAENDKIRIISQENGGVSAARNTGVLHAVGEYVAFVDSDDYVSPFYIERLCESAEQYDSDIVCCNYRNTNEDGSSGLDNFLVHRCGCFDGKTVFRAVLRDITVRSYVWNKLFRRTLFTGNNITFPLGMNFEDFAIMPQLFYHAGKVSFISDTLYYYAHRKGSIIGSISKRDVRNYLQAYASIRNFMESENIFGNNRFIYYILRKKISVTVFGMLLRCWWRDPKGTYVLANYSRSRKFLKLYSSEQYYFAESKKTELIAIE